jgi:hypothetical protein
VLPGVASHFRALARGWRQPPGPVLLASIDVLIKDMLAVSSHTLRHTGGRGHRFAPQPLSRRSTLRGGDAKEAKV